VTGVGEFLERLVLEAFLVVAPVAAQAAEGQHEERHQYGQRDAADETSPTGTEEEDDVR